MGFGIVLLLCSALLPAVSAQIYEHAAIIIDTSTNLAETDDHYICATIDWWPQDKCDYNSCPWGSSSALNLNLSHPFLNNAVEAFKTLRLRVGGSLQDRVLYDVGNLSSPCESFKKEKGGLFGFSTGCLSMKRWDELNKFFNRTGVIVTFGLNALQGRRHIRKIWKGDWDPINARNFMNYTLSKGYHIDSWEFGNELSGNGVGANVGAEQYAKDAIRLEALINQLYSNSRPTPIVAPGGFYDKSWFDKLLKASGPKVVDVVSHHMYTLGPGNGIDIMKKILNPDYLDRASFIFGNVTSTIRSNGPWASAWVSESGGAFNSGARDISNIFVNSFWYLDQLAMAAKYGTRVYCRQTLIGGFYGLLNKTTFVPNPDYYSALLWHRLMGKGVLSVNSSSSPYLRAYAHCAKGRPGITLLLINLSNRTTYSVELQSEKYAQLSAKNRTQSNRKPLVHRLNNLLSWVGNKGLHEALYREEYHLTPENGNLRSRVMVLNGRPLELTATGDIPRLGPAYQDVWSSVNITPLSIKFVVHPYFRSKGCE